MPELQILLKDAKLDQVIELIEREAPEIHQTNLQLSLFPVDDDKTTWRFKEEWGWQLAKPKPGTVELKQVKADVRVIFRTDGGRSDGDWYIVDDLIYEIEKAGHRWETLSPSSPEYLTISPDMEYQARLARLERCFETYLTHHKKRERMRIVLEKRKEGYSDADIAFSFAFCDTKTVWRDRKLMEEWGVMPED
jgi:hypothetical protein